MHFLVMSYCSRNFLLACIGRGCEGGEEGEGEGEEGKRILYVC